MDMNRERATESSETVFAASSYILELDEERFVQLVK